MASCRDTSPQQEQFVQARQSDQRRVHFEFLQPFSIPSSSVILALAPVLPGVAIACRVAPRLTVLRMFLLTGSLALACGTVPAAQCFEFRAWLDAGPEIRQAFERQCFLPLRQASERSFSL